MGIGGGIDALEVTVQHHLLTFREKGIMPVISHRRSRFLILSLPNKHKFLSNTLILLGFREYFLQFYPLLILYLSSTKPLPILYQNSTKSLLFFYKSLLQKRALYCNKRSLLRNKGSLYDDKGSLFRALHSLIQRGLAVMSCQSFYYELKSSKKNIFLP